MVQMVLIRDPIRRLFQVPAAGNSGPILGHAQFSGEVLQCLVTPNQATADL